VGRDGYILRSISRYEHIGNNLSPASVSIILKGLQRNLNITEKQASLSGHSFRVGATLDFLEQGEGIEKIMLRGMADGFDCHGISEKLEHIIQNTPTKIIFISLYS